jgi:hypothetical protein
VTRLKPTPALVVSVFALVVAMSGTAVAVSASINGSTIKVHSIPANRIKTNSLTGKQINEKKLKTVPSATSATKVNGITVKKVFRVIPSGGAEISIVQFGRLQVFFGCDQGGGNPQLDVTSRFTTGDATSFATEDNAVSTNDDANFDMGTQINLTDSGSFVRANGNLTVAWSDGHYSDFHFTDDDPDIFDDVDACVVAGEITYGG